MMTADTQLHETLSLIQSAIPAVTQFTSYTSINSNTNTNTNTIIDV